MFQSTHPHGVRHKPCYRTLPAFDGFNPRTHTGCDNFQNSKNTSNCNRFNPRTHTGCDSMFGTALKAESAFQSTHPHGVRHLIELYTSIGYPCFNPRTHTGCDIGDLASSCTAAVSIHAPTRGATRKRCLPGKP